MKSFEIIWMSWTSNCFSIRIWNYSFLTKFSECNILYYTSHVYSYRAGLVSIRNTRQLCSMASKNFPLAFLCFERTRSCFVGKRIFKFDHISVFAPKTGDIYTVAGIWRDCKTFFIALCRTEMRTEKIMTENSDRKLSAR